MTLGSKFAVLLAAGGAVWAGLPTEAEAFWGHHRRAAAYPVAVASPVVVSSPVVVARPVFAAPVVVARPIVSAPVVVGYAPTYALTDAAPTTSFYAPTTTYYAPTAPAINVAPVAAVPTTTYYAPAPVITTGRVIVVPWQR
jgi:hypothetical protein